MFISQATPTYTLPEQTEVYGQPFQETFSFANVSSATPPTGTIGFIVPGKQAICTLTGTLNPTTNICNAPSSGLPVGTYVIGFVYSGDSNYAPYSGAATLKVIAAPLTVTVASATRTYGVANPAFSAPSPAQSPVIPSPRHLSTPATITPGRLLSHHRCPQRPRSLELQRHRRSRHPHHHYRPARSQRSCQQRNSHLRHCQPGLRQHHYRRAQQ